MDRFLPQLINLSVIVFAAASMLSVGLGHTVAEIVDPLRKPQRVLRILLTNFVLVPLLGFFIVRVLPLDDEFAIGLFLVACAAGAPFLIKLTQAARGDVAFASALLVLLLPTTVLYLAVVVPIALPAAPVDAAAIARPLVLTMLVPLVVGLVVRRLLPRLAARAVPFLGRLSTVALILLLGGTILLNLREFVSLFGEGAIAAAFLLVLGAFAIGYTVGGRLPDTRNAVALATGQRNIGAATVVATQSLGGGQVMLMVVLIAVVGMVVLFPLAFMIRDRRRYGVRALRRREA